MQQFLLEIEIIIVINFIINNRLVKLFEYDAKHLKFQLHFVQEVYSMCLYSTASAVPTIK
jgi:hypothetical protein